MWFYFRYTDIPIEMTEKKTYITLSTQVSTREERCLNEKMLLNPADVREKGVPSVKTPTSAVV